jgi:TonB family protein
MMSALFIYAIKSAICLALLYFPYVLLMRRDTFYSMNRIVLLCILVLSVILPAIQLPIFDNSFISTLSGDGRAIIEVGLPQLDMSEAEKTAAAVSPEGARQELGVLFVRLLLLIYLLGMAITLVWKLVSLIRLTRFIPSGCVWTEKTDGVTIYCHLGQISPFSWMNKVVLSEEDYNENPSVLLHEKAHCHKGHSWDKLFVSLVEVFMWFNPCVWMLDHSLQEIHEYEADDAVLRHGVTSKNYQMLLIEKAISTSSYTFANGFNHSLLKKRITMMMKKKSNQWSRTKALYLLPVAVIALGAFATTKSVTTPAVISDSKVNANVLNGQNISSKNVENVAEVEGIAPALTIQDANEVEEKPTQLMPTEEATTPDADVYQDPDTAVFMVVETMPEFPGGMEALMGFMRDNLQYPPLAKEMGVQGRVMVQFVIDKTGKVSQARCIRGVPAPSAKANATEAEKARIEKMGDAALQINREALRVVEAMPDWKPGKQKGQNVNVRYTIPVTFKLQ